MNDFLAFRRMITPVIILILFWILTVLTVLGGLIALIGGLVQGEGMIAFLGLLYIILGPIAVRIWCELLIVFFRMNETLTDIKNVLESRSPDTPQLPPSGM